MQAATRSAEPPAIRTLLLLGAALVLAVLAAFSGAVGNSAILLDDPEYVFANPRVLAGLSRDGIAWAFSGIHAGNWHPLTTLSHMLDVELFGTSPAGHHAVNVALHALCALLCFVALQRLTRAVWASFAVALLFAVHPLRVESVAWIAERKDVLSGVFFWLTLLAYGRWAEQPSGRRYVLLAATYALALMTKPMLVTLPFVLLLLDAWPLARLGPDSAAGWSLGPRLREKLPLFALAAISVAVTYGVQRNWGAMVTAESIPFGQRIANAPVAVATYLLKTVWPSDLAPYYPFELRTSLLVPLACALGLACVTILAWTRLRARPWILVGWLWFVGMLVPVIGLVQVGGQALADRYTYLPSAGLAIAVVFTARALVERRPALRAPLMSALLVLVVASAIGVRVQTATWRSSPSISEHMLAATGDRNAFAHLMYANAVIEDDPAAARTHMQAALALVPALSGPHSGLGYLLMRENRFEEAAAEYRAELAIRPTVKDCLNLGLSLSRSGHPEDAIRAYERALEIDPRSRLAFVRLGLALALAGRHAEAAARFESALILDPRDPEVLRALGEVQTLAGNGAAGVASYERALEIAPDDARTLLAAAWIRATHRDASVRDAARSMQFVERARKLVRVDDACLLSALAAAQAETGKFTEALAAARRANELARGGDAALTVRTQQQIDAYGSGRVYRP